MRKYLNLLLERSLTSLFVFLLTGAVSTYADDSKSNQQILIVHSSYADYPWTASMHRGIQGGFENYPEAKDFWVEYIDTKRNLELNYFEKLHEFFNVKYQAKKIDLIIAVDNEAYDFILKDREQLFSGVPIVFAGYIGFESTTLNDKPLTTGVVQENDFEATIEIALQLHPNTKKVVFMLPDAWPERVAWVKHLPELYADRVDVINVTANTLEGIDHELVALGPDIVVIPLNSFQLETGRYLSFERFIEHLASVGDFPVYGLWDIALEHGIVGGKLVSGESQGREAAKLAIKILQGSPVNEVEVLKTSPNQFMFDWSQLQRFNIKLSELPAKSVVINRPESFYEKYTLLVWAASIILLLLLTLVVLLVINIANRREMVFALQESQQQQSDLLNNASSVIYMKDLDGRYMFINKVFQTLFNISNEEVKGKTDFEIFPDEIAVAFRTNDLKAIEAGVGIEIEEKATQDDGDHHYISVKFPLKKASGETYAVCGISTDITERKRLEEQVRRSQKMDAVGQMAGGIAHDFNNILAIILGNADLLALQKTNDSSSLKRVKTIHHTALRGAELTRQLLGFSRQKIRQTEIINANQLIGELDELIGRSITPQVEVRHHFADNLWLTKISPGDFQDALLNLIINARDAMTGKGKLNIDTRNTTLDDSFCKKNVGSQPGDYIEVSVSDSGNGISPEFIDKIFEPFFTTKEIGKGTGLGLSMVYGFIKRSGGYIHVYSEIDIGTTFKMYLPREMGEAQDDQQAFRQDTTLAHGTETLLVVDDEKDLLEVVQATLSTLGYRVLTASNGQQALEVLADEPSIALLFSDVVMPGGINGYELAGLVTNQRPDIKVLLASGYTGKRIAQNDPSRFNANFLNKPYTRMNLSLMIRDIIDEAV